MTWRSRPARPRTPNPVRNCMGRCLRPAPNATSGRTSKSRRTRAGTDWPESHAEDKRRSGSEVNRGPERPHRSPVPRNQATDESAIIVFVLAEVEEGVAIIAMDSEVTSGKDLEPAAGVPAEFRGVHVCVARSVEQLHLPSVPTRAP